MGLTASRTAVQGFPGGNPLACTRRWSGLWSFPPVALVYTSIFARCMSREGCDCTGGSEEPSLTWIYVLPTWIFALLAIAFFCALALAGLRSTRRLVPNDQIPYNDFVGPVFALIGTVLAVMMSFMVVAVYQQFDASAAVVDREAGAASDLHHIAELLPQPTRGNLKAAVDRYVTVVIDKDFPAMRNGGSSMEAFDDSSRLFETVSRFTPKTPAQTQLQSQSLSLALALIDARRQRLYDNQSGIPPILWVVMFLSAAILLVTTYFFRVSSASAHNLMTLALTGVIAAIFVLIAELDYPFRGDTSVGAASFGRVNQIDRRTERMFPH